MFSRIYIVVTAHDCGLRGLPPILLINLDFSQVKYNSYFHLKLIYPSFIDSQNLSARDSLEDANYGNYVMNHLSSTANQ